MQVKLGLKAENFKEKTQTDKKINKSKNITVRISKTEKYLHVNRGIYQGHIRLTRFVIFASRCSRSSSAVAY